MVITITLDGFFEYCSGMVLGEVWDINSKNDGPGDDCLTIFLKRFTVTIKSITISRTVKMATQAAQYSQLKLSNKVRLLKIKNIT